MNDHDILNMDIMINHTQAYREATRHHTHMSHASPHLMVCGADHQQVGEGRVELDGCRPHRRSEVKKVMWKLNDADDKKR